MPYKLFFREELKLRDWPAADRKQALFILENAFRSETDLVQIRLERINETEEKIVVNGLHVGRMVEFRKMVEPRKL